MSVNHEGNDRGEKDPSNAGANNPASNNPDGGIPGHKEGVGLGADSEPNSFEPEEDPESTEESEDASGETFNPS